MAKKKSAKYEARMAARQAANRASAQEAIDRKVKEDFDAACEQAINEIRNNLKGIIPDEVRDAFLNTCAWTQDMFEDVLKTHPLNGRVFAGLAVKCARVYGTEVRISITEDSIPSQCKGRLYLNELSFALRSIWTGVNPTPRHSGMLHENCSGYYE